MTNPLSTWNGHTKTVVQVIVGAAIAIGTMLGIDAGRGEPPPQVPLSSFVSEKLDKQGDALHRIELLLVRIEENTRTK